MSNKKSALALIIVLVVVISLVFSNSSSKTKEVRIGVVAPLNGGAAVFGNSLVKGIEMAKQDIEGGNISNLQNLKYTYKLFIEDDGSTPAKAATAASKLVNIDKVDAIITTTSISGNAVKPIAESAHLPHICVCSDTSIASSTYSFTNSLLPKDEMEGWLSEAQKQGIKHVALLQQNHPGFTISLNYLNELAPKYGIDIVYKDSFDGEVRDFKTIAKKAVASKADIYFLATYPPMIDILAKDLKVLGEEKISSYAMFAISPTPELYNNKWYTDANLSDAHFADKFKQLNPDIRFNVRTAPFGYDSYALLVQAFEKDKKDPTKALNSVTNFSMMAGPTVKESLSHSFRSIPAVWIIKDGKSEIVK